VTRLPPGLYTGRYFNPLMWRPGTNLVGVRITLGMARHLKYAVPFHVRELAPHGRIFNLEGQAFDVAYRRQLERHGVERIAQRLSEVRQAAGPEAAVVLLCFERCRLPGSDVVDETGCHRRVFATWWLERTGEVVPELPEP